MEPKVKLLSWTPNPIETLYAIEKFAKTDIENPLLTDPDHIADIRSSVKGDRALLHSPLGDSFLENLLKTFPNLVGTEDPWLAYVKEVEEWSLKVAKMAIPVAEFIHFTFEFSNVSIAFREQLVRHRTNSYWIQSGRITDYSTIFDRGAYHIPEPIANDPELLSMWHRHWKNTQEEYQIMKAKGIKDEDAREIVGNGALHRLSMDINLRSLIDLTKHRTCYIAQGHWVPVVIGMVRELVEKVDPVFEILGHPPCWNENKKFIGCKYEGMCSERYSGKDPLPVCPIYQGNKQAAEPDKSIPTDELKRLGRWDSERNKQFGRLWNKKDL